MRDKTEREIDTIRKRRIGFVFQHYVLLNNLTVLENVEIALRVIGVVSAGSRKRASLHALKLVGLREHADKFPYELSGGQKQRVAIARAFVKNPDIIIADEPTAALDSRTGKEILDLLTDLCRTKLLIIATHNKSIVRDYGSRVIELKSGYTIKNELITDRSKVKVDELDLIIDKEIDEDDIKIQKIIDIEKKVSEDNKATVLKDLGVDLENFTLNNEDKFNIDEELKKRLIKERMKNTKLNTRIYRFLQTSDDFHGKKRYANKSFFRNIGLHLFSSLIFTVFMLTIVFGLNFVTETFGGFNEKAMYSRTMRNENVLFFVTEDYEVIEEDQNLYEDLELAFISDFTQTDVQGAKFLNELLIDPYFRYQYEQDQIKYIYDKLAEDNHEDAFSIYYNNSNIISKTSNEDIVFTDLSYIYNNAVTTPAPYTYVVDFMNYGLETDLIYQFDFVYSENNSTILSTHLLEGSRLPVGSNEVVVPVAYLFKYEILNPSDFKDEHGNLLEIIPSESISKAFEALSESQRTIEIAKTTVTLNDVDGVINEEYDVEVITFDIVGLINFDGDINPYLELRNDVIVLDNASTNFSFVFSKEAEDNINFELVNNSVLYSFDKSILYAEISKEKYNEYNVKGIVEDFDEEYIGEIKDNIADIFYVWIEELNTASLLVSDYVTSDFAGEGPNGDFLSDEVNSEMFPELVYQDILDYYLAQHLYVISDSKEFDTLCPPCNFGSRTFDGILEDSSGAYEALRDHDEYWDVVENFSDVSRLTYQETTNRIIYEYYGHLFNNMFYESANGDYYDFKVVNSFERERGSILSLLNAVIPRVVMEFIPFFDRFQNMIIDLESNPSFIQFMESTNLDLLISSISTNAVRSLVLVILYTVIYLMLLLSIMFLSIVLINLYGNIYESATRKRIKELASLRVLGTSYDDIQDMIRIENRRVALFSYGSFIGILFILSKLNLFTEAPIKHFYMPLLGLFFDFNLFDVFVMNYVVIFVVTIIFYLFIYKFIIRRVSTKKTGNIDTIQAIRDGDNL